MKHLVVDASVAVKWVLPQAHEKGDEEHLAQALSVLHGFRDGEVMLTQPPHWLAEVGAVLARFDADVAKAALVLFDAMEIPTRSEPEIYTLAIELATEMNHHLFDTLYHAVALHLPDTTLVTADLRYYRKARRLGAICPLADVIHT